MLEQQKTINIVPKIKIEKQPFDLHGARLYQDPAFANAAIGSGLDIALAGIDDFYKAKGESGIRERKDYLVQTVSVHDEPGHGEVVFNGYRRPGSNTLIVNLRTNKSISMHLVNDNAMVQITYFTSTKKTEDGVYVGDVLEGTCSAAIQHFATPVFTGGMYYFLEQGFIDLDTDFSNPIYQ